MVALIEILTAFWQLLIAPIKNPEMLWILVPVYLNWILTDYYQERRGTSFGNAMSNGFVAIWVGLDWTRQLATNFPGFSAAFAVKLAVGIFFVVFGLVIMFESAKARPIVKYLGRIREVSYFIIVATPIYYNVIPINLNTILAILVFFPVWYLIGEAFDRALGPSAGEQEEETESVGAGLGGLGVPDAGMDLGMAAIGLGGQNTLAGQQPQSPYQQYPQQNYANSQQWPPQY